MTIKELTEAVHQHKIKERPNVPLHAIPRTVYSDRTANDLQTAIKHFCDMQGVLCERRGNEGRYRPGGSVVDVIGRTRIMKGTYLPGQNNGQSDLEITLKGRRHCVEVKIGKDVQSDAQKTFQSKVEKAGGIYVIVKSWEDFYKNYIKWKK